MTLYLHTFNRVSDMTPLQLAQRLAGDVRDEAWLEHCITLAQQSMTAMQALRWAAVNDIKIGIGAVPAMALGCYAAGSSRINMAADVCKNMGAAEIGTLVHEIRHAWQDQRGLLPLLQLGHVRYGRIDYALMQNALVEADAYAYGKLAEAEILYLDYTANVAQCHYRLQRTFMSWFIERAGFYGQSMRQLHEDALHHIMPVFNVPAPTGINPYDRAHLIALGRGFCGNHNYMTTWKGAFDYIRKYALHSRFQGSDRNAVAAALDIHKQQIRQRVTLCRLRKQGVKP